MMDGGLTSVAEIRERLNRAREQRAAGEVAGEVPAFDCRPGALEATRGLDRQPPSVAGLREREGWKVALLTGIVTYALTPAQARALAVDLADYANLAEYGFFPGDPGAAA